jgi:uncharacterized membrane protein
MAIREITRDTRSELDWSGDGRQNGRRRLNEEKIARGLGWFSLGLGLVGLVAPGRLAKLIGLRRNHNVLLRVLGAREVTSGVGILAGRRPNSNWMWSRVGGGAIDLALLGAAFRQMRPRRNKLAMTTAAVAGATALGAAFRRRRPNRNRLAMTTAAVAGVTALDAIFSRRLSRLNGARDAGVIRMAHAVTINRSQEELYRSWRDFQNLPRFMKHLESVRVTGDRRSHWVAKAPGGRTVEWDAEITEDRPNELIAWRSLEGADVDSVGSVRFERAPGGRGTTVKVEMQYSPPAGRVGATVAKLLGKGPEWRIKDDLRRFKQLMEVGEVITTEGQSAGRASGTSWRYDLTGRS